MIKTFIDNSEYQKLWVFKKLNNFILKKYRNPKIFILGLSYKENTNSIKNSPSIFLLKKLKKFNINVFDPIVKKVESLKNIKHMNSVEEGLDGCDILIIMTPWQLFKKITYKTLFKKMKNKTILDPYSLLNLRNNQKSKFDYFSLGRNSK